jgi:hypothetical protein
MTSTTKTADLNIRGIPKDLRRRFKVACADKGVTMTEAVVSLITGVVTGQIMVPFNKKTKRR